MELINDTLGGLLEKWAQEQPDHDFLVYPDRNLRFSYRQFNERVDTLAKALLEIGVTKGSKVGVWAKNVPDWLTFMFASARIGAVLVTVNTNYKAAELKYIMQDADIHTMCLVNGYRDSDYVQIMYEVVPELRSSERGRLHSDEFPELRNVVYIGQEKQRGMYTTAELLTMGSYASDEALLAAKAQVNPFEEVNMQYTSGTTGFPKGVMLTHHNILNNGLTIGDCMHYTNRDKVLTCVPLFHCFGCVLGVMACVNHGATMVLLDAFSPVQVMTAVEQEKCTALYGVPTMFQAILDHRVFSRFDFSSLRTGIMAGSVCPEPLMRRVMDQMCMSEITICYGLTEGSPVMTQTRTDDTVERRVKTVGRSMPGIEVTIRDPETNEEVPRNAVGEVCCRGYNVMQGYYNMPKDTAEAIDEEGWLHSGDLGIMDEDGYVSISGRIKDMIIRGGENVYPREVEEFLLKMDGVADVQDVAVPSRRYGEEVGAFLIPKEGADVAPEDVRDYCRGKIAWYKIPRYVAVVEGFPLTASGKIQKYKLREMAAAYFPEAMRERNGLPSRGRRGTA